MQRKKIQAKRRRRTFSTLILLVLGILLIKGAVWSNKNPEAWKKIVIEKNELVSDKEAVKNVNLKK